MRSWREIHSLVQRGPNAFDLRVILPKRDNSRATSSKMMYNTTDLQHFKIIRE